MSRHRGKFRAPSGGYRGTSSREVSLPYHPTHHVGPPMFLPPDDSYREDEFLFKMSARTMATTDRSKPRFLKGIDQDFRTLTPPITYFPDFHLERKKQMAKDHTEYYRQRLTVPEDDMHEARRIVTAHTGRDLFMKDGKVFPRRVLVDDKRRTLESRTGLSRDGWYASKHSDAPPSTMDVDELITDGPRVAYRKRVEKFSDPTHLASRYPAVYGDMGKRTPVLDTKIKSYDESKTSAKLDRFVDSTKYHTTMTPTFTSTKRHTGKRAKPLRKELHRDTTEDPLRKPRKRSKRRHTSKIVRKPRIVPSFVEHMLSHPPRDTKMGLRRKTSSRLPMGTREPVHLRSRGAPLSPEFIEAFIKRRR